MSKTGYTADSSWFASSTGGKKYHLTGKFPDASLCGLVPMLAGFTATPWDDVPEILKCKCCIRKDSTARSAK